MQVTTFTHALSEGWSSRPFPPLDTELGGFYSYGKISPYARGRCGLRNQTMTLTPCEES